MLPAAGTQGGGGGQGGVAAINAPGPVAAVEDFAPWREEHADRLLSPDEPYAILRPALKVRCEKLAGCGALPLECPFTLGGLAKLEKQLGAQVYQPVAHACGFPFHPSCPRRCGEKRVPCHSHTFPHWNALVQHARNKGAAWGEEGGADLHMMLREELVMLRPDRR